MKVKVIGAGLAGCEAAWQLASNGIDVELYEMKPLKYTPAHTVITSYSIHYTKLYDRH